MIPSNGLHSEATKAQDESVGTLTLPAKVSDRVDLISLHPGDTGGKSSETLPIIEPESEDLAVDGKEVVAVSQNVSEAILTNTTQNFTIPAADADIKQDVNVWQDSEVAGTDKNEVAANSQASPVGDTIQEEPNRLSMEQLKEQSAQQRAAIAELQDNLDKARAHAKELLGKVSELEKARASQESAERAEAASQHGGESAWGTFVSSVLSAVQRVVGAVCGTTSVSPTPGPADTKDATGEEQPGRALSIARQFDNLWVRLRGGERCKSSSELNQVGGEEVDKALKLAGAQAAHALSRIEALELSISRLIETAACEFPLEIERRS